MTRSNLARIVVMLAVCGQAPTVESQENRSDAGLGANALPGGGGPVDVAPGSGVIARYWLDDRWFAGVAPDAYGYGLGKPATLLGITRYRSVNVTGSSGDVSGLGRMLGRRFGENDSGFDWFRTVDIGFPRVADGFGPADMGIPFGLTFGAGLSTRVITTRGASHHFTSKWFAGFAERLDHRFSDITVTGRAGGASAAADTRDARSPAGGYFPF